MVSVGGVMSLVNSDGFSGRCDKLPPFLQLAVPLGGLVGVPDGSTSPVSEDRYSGGAVSPWVP